MASHSVPDITSVELKDLAPRGGYLGIQWLLVLGS